MDDPGTDGEREYHERFLDEQFEEEYPDLLFLESIRECELASTKNVADRVGCDRATAWRRLKKLEEEEGVLESVPVGGAKVWKIRSEGNLSD
ncbi:winged helix-turn-helix domain-containing protein [Halomontanus rarus]|uniref:winged helix-turn-helix domain-containing protein n=1 Tax=Halomontanus rarus TaxID=3034020 RepID=UPI0023E82F9A|nr:winged helix-turn-helix domain-containing protein [Halovivax sp. TS33]